MTTTVDEDRLGAFLGQAIGDVGATISAGLVVLGDRLGLYRAMADGAPVTVEELAARTGTAVVYLRPWLANQAAGGYVEYDPADETWWMTPEKAYALAVEDGTAFLPGSMQLALGVLRDLPAIEECFRTGAGLGWHEHDPDLYALGRVFYGASTLVCTPSSLAQPGARALGPQAGPAQLTALLSEAGFRSVRIAATTPVNLIIEARP